MDDTYLFTWLCWYNPLNPCFDSESEKPSDKCFCDNCFYGRNELVLEIIRLKEIKTSIYDSMGNKQVYLIRPNKVDYAVDNCGQVSKLWLQQSFKTYRTCCVKGFEGGIRIQLDFEQAISFASLNGLKIINEGQQEDLLNNPKEY